MGTVFTGAHQDTKLSEMDNSSSNINLLLDNSCLRRNPIEDGTISGFSGQKSVPE